MRDVRQLYVHARSALFGCVARSFVNRNFYLFICCLNLPLEGWCARCSQSAATIPPAFKSIEATFPVSAANGFTCRIAKSHSVVGSVRATCPLVSVKTFFGNTSDSYIHNRTLRHDSLFAAKPAVCFFFHYLFVCFCVSLSSLNQSRRARVLAVWWLPCTCSHAVEMPNRRSLVCVEQNLFGIKHCVELSRTRC